MDGTVVGRFRETGGTVVEFREEGGKGYGAG